MSYRRASPRNCPPLVRRPAGSPADPDAVDLSLLRRLRRSASRTRSRRGGRCRSGTPKAPFARPRERSAAAHVAAGPGPWPRRGIRAPGASRRLSRTRRRAISRRSIWIASPKPSNALTRRLGPSAPAFARTADTTTGGGSHPRVSADTEAKPTPPAHVAVATRA